MPTLNRKQAVNRVMKMMAIPGKSGGEGAIASFIREALVAAGVKSQQITTDSTHRKSPIGGESGNVIVKLPAKGMRGPRRLMMAHIDTVPLCVGCQPIRRGRFIVSKDKTTALGGDDRAGACVVLTTALELAPQASLVGSPLCKW